MEHSEPFNDFAAAFAAAQVNIGGAIKDRQNPAFRSQYADLSAVFDACKDALNDQGIGIMQVPAQAEKGACAVETMLLHKSGQWARCVITLPMGKMDPQGYGSAFTYARRYSLSGMVGVCPEDDDGNAASGHREPPARQPAAKPEPAQQPTTETKPDPKVLGRIQDALKARGFTASDAGEAFKEMAKKAKVKNLAALPAARVDKLIEAIGTGYFDSFKSQAEPGEDHDIDTQQEAA